MKNNISLLLLFFTTNVYCQDISYIKTLDTIFVSFKEDSFQIKTVLPANSKGFQRWYVFYFEKNNKKENLYFWVSEYPGYRRREMNNKSDIRLVKNSFLKKHKNQIVGIDFFKNYDICALRDVFFNKVVYIIDTVERKKRKTTLYEVNPSFSCDPIE
ncbi:hypothetical protein [Flavobacterium geliluteum]|uniref:Uncharacterized protein n=1 Tax=Flavobacterium geliluteum TaxID=2816120 RepID=A0A940XBF9_9FLAO|nr:hypothetical protein [Flavobacterium geliluteum]MBP4139412.1 hypothetical protein [Flavobacterium geliluteum]